MQRPKLTYDQCHRLNQKLANFSSVISQFYQGDFDQREKGVNHNDYRSRDHKRHYRGVEQRDKPKNQEMYHEQQQQEVDQQSDKYFYPIKSSCPKTTKETGKQNLYKRKGDQQRNLYHQQESNTLNKPTEDRNHMFRKDKLSRIEQDKQNQVSGYCTHQRMKRMLRNQSDTSERDESDKLRQISLNEANYHKPRNGARNRNPDKEWLKAKQLNRSCIDIDPKYINNLNHSPQINEWVGFDPDIQKRIKHVESVKLNKSLQDGTWGYSIIESKAGHIQGSMDMNEFSSVNTNQIQFNNYKRKDQNQSYDQDQLYLNRNYYQNKRYVDEAHYQNHSQDLFHYQTQTHSNEPGIGGQHQRLWKNYDSCKESEAESRNSIPFPSYQQKQSSINELNGQIKQIMSKYDYEFAKDEISSLLDNQRITLPSMRKVDNSSAFDNIELQLDMMRPQRQINNHHDKEELEKQFSPYQIKQNQEGTEKTKELFKKKESQNTSINNSQRDKSRLQGNFKENSLKSNEENVFDKIQLKTLTNQEASSINEINQKEKTKSSKILQEGILQNSNSNPIYSNFATATINCQAPAPQHNKSQFMTYRQKRQLSTHQQNSFTVSRQQSKLDSKIEALNRKIKEVQDQKRLLNIEFKPFQLDNFISKLNSRNPSSNHTLCHSQQLNQGIYQHKITVSSLRDEIIKTNQNNQNEEHILIKIKAPEEQHKNRANQDSQTPINNLHEIKSEDNFDHTYSHNSQPQTKSSVDSEIPVTTAHQINDGAQQTKIMTKNQSFQCIEAHQNDDKTSTEWSTIQVIPFEEEKSQNANQKYLVSLINEKNKVNRTKAQIKKQLISKDDKINQIQTYSSKFQPSTQQLSKETNNLNKASMSFQKKLNKSSLFLKKTCNAKNELQKLILLTLRQIDLDHEFRDNKIHFEFNFKPTTHLQQQSEHHLQNVYHTLKRNNQQSSSDSQEDQKKWRLLESQFLFVRNKKVQELRLIEQSPQQDRRLYDEEQRVNRLMIQIMNLDYENLHKVFSLNLNEHDPFSAIFSSNSINKDDQTNKCINDIPSSSSNGTLDLDQSFISKLVKSYVSSYTHFYKHIYKQFNAKELISNGFRSQVIDIQSKGYAQVNDLVRFFNISTNSMYRNRDFIMFFNRILNQVHKSKRTSKVMHKVDTNTATFQQNVEKDVFKKTNQSSGANILIKDRIRFKELLYVFCPTQRL